MRFLQQPGEPPIRLTWRKPRGIAYDVPVTSGYPRNSLDSCKVEWDSNCPKMGLGSFRNFWLLARGAKEWRCAPDSSGLDMDKEFMQISRTS
jgi:hypothetical protein